MTLRIGIDVGGTFTDGVAVDEMNGAVTTAKTFTTYGDLSDGVLQVVKELSGTNGQGKGHPDPSKAISSIFHGTTLVSNALVERKVPPIGLLCTAGFRDVLDTRRTRRKYLYDIMWNKPENLVRRLYRREVVERLNYHGEVLTPIDEATVKDAVAFLARNGIKTLAVSYLYSFLNPTHERRTRDIILEMLPEAEISLSSDVIAEQREFERTTTTILNAMVKGLIDRYLGRLESALTEQHIDAPLQIMKANGGVARTATVRAKPVETYESGPAAGVTAAVAFGQMMGVPNLLTLDMGGTTTDVSLVWNGRPLMTLEEELEWSLPIRIPMIQIRSIGSGGGSLGWIDKGGALRVGPASAGSEPGPACYGRGGTKPTVTDADVVLGRLNPKHILGGKVSLNAELARKAIQEHIAEFLHLDVVQAAHAISQISAMDQVHLIREVTVNRGYDPRSFSLMCFGGAGAMYAVQIARELEISEVIIPTNPGVFSATGCLYADIHHEYVQTYITGTDGVNLGKLNEVFGALRQRAIEDLRRDRVTQDVTFEHFLDLRYHGEAYQISIPVDYSAFGRDSRFSGEGEAYQITVPVNVNPEGHVTEEGIDVAVRQFHSEHERLYGFNREDPVENVNVMLRALVPLPNPKVASNTVRRELSTAVKGRRPVYFGDSFSDTPIYDRYRLGYEAVIEGPAVIEEDQATIVLPPKQTARVDEYQNIRVQVRGEDS